MTNVLAIASPELVRDLNLASCDVDLAPREGRDLGHPQARVGTEPVAGAMAVRDDKRMLQEIEELVVGPDLGLRVLDLRAFVLDRVLGDHESVICLKTLPMPGRISSRGRVEVMVAAAHALRLPGVERLERIIAIRGRAIIVHVPILARDEDLVNARSARRPGLVNATMRSTPAAQRQP